MVVLGGGLAGIFIAILVFLAPILALEDRGWGGWG
jgi:hypothetical protein